MLLTCLDVGLSYRLTAAGMAQLSRLPLRELRVIDCMLGDELLPQLAALRPGLTALSLSETLVHLDAPGTPTALAGLTALERLQLLGCRLAPAGLAALAAGCTSLRELDVSHSKGLASVGALAPLGALLALTRLDVRSMRGLVHPDLALPSTLAALSRLVHLDVSGCLPTNKAERARFPRAPSGSGGGMATRRSAAGAALFWPRLAEALPHLSALTYLGWRANLAPLLQLDAAQAAAQAAAAPRCLHIDAATEAAAAAALGHAEAGPGLDKLVLLLRGLAAATPASVLQQLDAADTQRGCTRWYYERVVALLAERLLPHVHRLAGAGGSSAGAQATGGVAAELPALLRALLPRLRLLHLACGMFDAAPDDADAEDAADAPGVVHCG